MVFMKILNLNNLNIYKQLQIEEALLRADTDEWCLINTGSADSVVMGISGKLEKLVHLKQAQAYQLPVIRRYSGGGTVLIDPNTIFITLIGNGKKFPRPLLEEGEKLLTPLFPPGFTLKENDYVIGDLKIGGNAQYLSKNRWMHHVSFLWDYDPKKMDVLHLPEKRPDYRQSRSHEAFLTKLADYYPCKAAWLEDALSYLIQSLNGTVVDVDLDELCQRPHRKGTSIAWDPQELSLNSYSI